MNDLGVYVLTYDAPNQLELFTDKLKTHQSAIYDSKKHLINNTYKTSIIEEYKDSGEYDIIHHSFNVGITEARQYAAIHSYDKFKYHLYFEDDHLCKPAPDFLETAIEIVDTFDLDYLRLSHKASYGRTQWNRMNVQKTETREINGIPFILENSFYSNCPILFSRKGIYNLFIKKRITPNELGIARLAKKLMESGEVKTGTLLIEPFQHDRKERYLSERKEHVNGNWVDKYRLMAMTTPQ